MKTINPIKSYSGNRDLSLLLLCTYCLVAAISIAATRIVIVPFILLWLLRSRLQEKRCSLRQDDGVFQLTTSPILLWILVAAVSSIVGVDFNNSIDDVAKDGFYFLFPFAIVSLMASYSLEEGKSKVLLLLSLLCIGQGLAALRSVFSATTFELSLGLPGPLTESGQIVLVLPILIALIHSASAKIKDYSLQQIALGGIIICILSILSWRTEIFSSIAISSGLTLLLLVAIFYLWKKSYPQPDLLLLKNSFITSALAILMVGTLIINLKRGPWLGAGFAIVVLGLILSKRLALWTICTMLAALLLPPVQHRLLDSAEHFSIVGGRQEMWGIGVELAQRFPLGLGMKNAYFMQTLDPLIPDTHRHMHSNLLNVLVETGWLGLAIFIWLFFVITKIGIEAYQRLKRQNQPLLANCLIAMSVALLGWQVAGLVEYNYGDGEIRMISLFYLGLILYGARFAAANTPDKLS